MPDPTFIPGYLGTVLINAENVSAIGSVVRLNKRRNVMTKPTFGNPWGFSLGGQKIGAFSASGHISAEQAAALEAAYDAGSVAFSLQVGEAAGATDAGVHTGNCVISDYTIEANADGEFDWSIDAQTTGTVTYTPAGS
jgi:predicted secreted protein